MKFFTCVLNLGGGILTEPMLRPFEAMPRSRQLHFDWHRFGALAVLAGGDEPVQETPIAAAIHGIGVGYVRLDNRDDVAGHSVNGESEAGEGDLDRVLHAVATRGPDCVRQFIGDFAFVVWQHRRRRVIAACDAFAIRRLFYCSADGLLCFSSRGEALAAGQRYNSQYLAQILSGCSPTPELSPYSRVSAVAAGTVAVFNEGRQSVRRYWSAYDFEPQGMREPEAVDTCRELLVDAVRTRMCPIGTTWSHLSGGMDSSSVVCTVQWLLKQRVVTRGLAGTVTFVDSFGTGADEQEYSDAVVSGWSVPNVKIIDAPVWLDERQTAPWLDEPSVSLIYHPRDRRLCEIVRDCGGRVLLTGAGGDVLFTGNMFFFADWLARGRFRRMATEVVHRAALGRVSAWELAYRNAILPLLPVKMRRKLVCEPGQVPTWVRRSIVRDFDLDGGSLAVSSYAGRAGRKYQHAVAVRVAAVAGGLQPGIVADTLDVRHPFLHRPLVEFALRLSPELCVRPHERKWVLREAMRNILPEAVRQRVGKGAPYGRLAWSLASQRAALEPLLDEPILADLGIIEPRRLKEAFELARSSPDSRQRLHGAIHHTLSVEAWLQIRAGRWPRVGHRSLHHNHTRSRGTRGKDGDHGQEALRVS